MSESFAVTLKPANLVAKADIDEFGKKADFDDKLTKINKNVTSNKKIHVEANKGKANWSKK